MSPCPNYTARKWSPLSPEPEDARCVNCGQGPEAHDRRLLLQRAVRRTNLDLWGLFGLVWALGCGAYLVWEWLR
jgi:hypothetical protein